MSTNRAELSRRGRLIVKHPISTSRRKVEIPIRLNVHTGIFSAELDGHLIESDTLTRLRQLLINAAKMADGDQVSPILVQPSESVKIIDIQDVGEE